MSRMRSREGDKNNQGKDLGEGKDGEKAEQKQAGGENEGNSAPELTALERHDLQNKVSALMACAAGSGNVVHSVPWLATSTRAIRGSFFLT
jgi:hypothetical protein